ncbi:MAG: MFS transporter [Gemmataceae bacterium]|nr:MFS transporter [Gemmataceae bacterium]
MDERAGRTYTLEKRRAVAAGILDTGFSTFLVLLAVRDLHATPLEKGLLVSGNGLGYLLAPVVTSALTAFPGPVSTVLAAAWGLAAVCLALAALVPGTVTYLCGGILASAILSAVIPLHTHVYQRNYGPEERGRLFSRTNLLRILCGSAAGWLIGAILGRGLIGRPTLLLGYAAAAGVAAACLFRLPTGRFDGAAVPNPLRSFRHLRRDSFFSATLVYWMLMGFGVLMMLPFRVEYLANPAHGRGYREADIALLVTIIPNAGRIVGNPLWGAVWNRLDLFQLRLLIDALFILGILGFFGSSSWTVLAVSSLLLGVSTAGAEISWTLWVTKFAPDRLVAEYMGVHLFFTGVRALAAPLVTFQFAERLSVHTLMWVSVGLIAVANLAVLRESRRFAPRYDGPA